MDIAYLVIAYKDPCQIQRLVRALSLSGDVYIHINRKVDITPFLNLLKQEDRLFWSSKRYVVNWGGFSILQATFQLMSDALKTKKYDRYVLLTGQDYPIKSPEYIKKYFKERYDTDFIYGAEYDIVKRQSLREVFFYDKSYILRGLLQIFKEILPHRIFLLLHDYVLYNGNKYPLRGLGPKWSICGSTAEILYSFYTKNKRFNRQFKYMHAPDDSYLPTVYPILFENLIASQEPIFYHLTAIGVLKDKDFESIQETPCLFARKFETGISDGILEKIDREIVKSKG